MKRLSTIALAVGLWAGPALAQEAPPPQPPPQPPPEAPKQPWTKKLFVGGSAGLSFGSDVDSIVLAPLVGYKVVPRFDVGAQPFYRYAKYKVYDPDVKTNDYGIDLFARFHVVAGFFLEAQGEWIDHEYVQADLSTARRSDTYWYGGVGYAIGAGHVGVYVTALYNFNYDANDPFRAYDSPWSVQVGAAVGF